MNECNILPYIPHSSIDRMTSPNACRHHRYRHIYKAMKEIEKMISAFSPHLYIYRFTEKNVLIFPGRPIPPHWLCVWLLPYHVHYYSYSYYLNPHIEIGKTVESCNHQRLSKSTVCKLPTTQHNTTQHHCWIGDEYSIQMWFITMAIITSHITQHDRYILHTPPALSLQSPIDDNNSNNNNTYPALIFDAITWDASVPVLVDWITVRRYIQWYGIQGRETIDGWIPWYNAEWVSRISFAPVMSLHLLMISLIHSQQQQQPT